MTGMVDDFCDAIMKRFTLTEKSVVNATKILNFRKWPAADSADLQGLTKMKFKVNLMF